MKSDLRKQARLARKTLAAAATAETATQLAAQFIAGPLAAWQKGKPVIAGYWPFGSEIDTRPLLMMLAEQGHHLALPVSGAVGQPLSFREWQPGRGLARDVMTMQAPPIDAPLLTPDIVIVPALAFDKTGHRLGYGKGYYDITLQQLRATRSVVAVVVAYAGQEVDTVHPGPHDAAVDWIVTEAFARKVATRVES